MLLENCEGMLAKEFASKICSIEQEFGLVSVGEGGDDAMEVSEGKNTGDVNKSQNPGNQDYPKLCPLTKPGLITFELVDMDEDDENKSKDSDITQYPPRPGQNCQGD